MRSVRAVFVAVPLFLACVCGAAAQETVSKQFWFDYNPRRALNPSYDLRGELILRTNTGARDWTRMMVRAHVLERTGRFRFAGGLGTVYTYNGDGADRFELRPFQAVLTRWPDRRMIRLDHYVRLEERLEWGTDEWDLDTSLRARYRLQTEYGREARVPGASWRFLLHIEAFYTVAGNAGQFDETTRFGGGAERSLGTDFRVRFDAIWQKSADLFSGDFSRISADALYLRLRVFHRLGG